MIMIPYRPIDLVFLVLWYAISIPCVLYCLPKIANSIARFIICRVERNRQLKLFSLVFSVFFVPPALADKIATKELFRYGEKVRVASCKSENGQDWKSTGYPNAVKVPIRNCGRKGKVVNIRRTCAHDLAYINPELGKLDSCDPWEYTVEFEDGTRSVYYAHQLGRGSKPRNRIVDFVCDDKAQECDVTVPGKKEKIKIKGPKARREADI